MRRRVLTLTVAALLMCWLLGQLNHYLAVWQIQAWCGGLLVAFSGLRMGYRTGAASAFVAGLLMDAGAPVPFGTQALLLLAGHAVVFTVRNRAPREETIVGVVVALVANLGLFMALCFLRLDTSVAPAESWMRAFADLLVSQLAIAVVAPWFFALQSRLLAVSGLETRELSRRTF